LASLLQRLISGIYSAAAHRLRQKRLGYEGAIELEIRGGGSRMAAFITIG
jgi:hypothetical protein